MAWAWCPYVWVQCGRFVCHRLAAYHKGYEGRGEVLVQVGQGE